MDFTKIIRDIPDFPEKGIMFRDITTVFMDAEPLKAAIDAVCEHLKNVEFDLILGPESRGFIFGVPAAYVLNKGFIPVRKAGKLPHDVVSKSYELEYGKATIEIHKDAIKPGQKVAIVDDLLATGGTCKAICELVEEMGGEVVSMSFFIELLALGGKDVLAGYDINSVVKY
ncbi:MAG: adenine phosphoribosyltransferase [Defluviitaleaceae bacterium]|nr:adenine phosphoribosyltransferase [Defluviitaleaceae bacterium]